MIGRNRGKLRVIHIPLHPLVKTGVALPAFAPLSVVASQLLEYQCFSLTFSSFSQTGFKNLFQLFSGIQ